MLSDGDRKREKERDKDRMSVEVDTMFLNCLKGAIQLPDDENMVYFGNVLASNVTDRR